MLALLTFIVPIERGFHKRWRLQQTLQRQVGNKSIKAVYQLMDAMQCYRHIDPGVPSCMGFLKTHLCVRDG